MQSCPRCGTPIGPDERSCPRCGAALSAAPAVFSDLTSDAVAPKAPPAAGSAQPKTESWGPGTWGPGAELDGLLPPAGRVSPPPTPQGNQPPLVREYSPGSAPRPAPPYRPPVRPPGGPYPGYPLIPANGQAPTAPGYPIAPATPYPAYPAYPGLGSPYGWYPPPRPPRAPGETYQKVLSILALIACCLLILGGLLLLVILVALPLANSGQDLSSVTLVAMAAIFALAGGGAGFYHSIRALTRQPSAPLSLPHYGLLAAASLAVLGTGLALFALNQPAGSLALTEPLILLSGILPAFTFLALALQRLQVNVSWRRMTLALTSGATLSIGAALVLELILTWFLALTFNISTLDPTNFNPGSSPSVAIGFLILLAVGAPVVEETTKQISGFLLLPRIKRPQEAFLIGLASGIGFAMVETADYIGSGQADWIDIAIQRVGAGLLHGMGAAMAGLGWYYLIKGRGMRRRWLIGFGCLIYAYVQHAIFNGGAVLLLILIKPLQTWHFDIFELRFDASVLYAFALYAVILGVLLVVTRRLRQPTPRVALATTSVAPGQNGAHPPANNQVSANGDNWAAIGTKSSATGEDLPGSPNGPDIPSTDVLPSGTQGSSDSGGSV
jgi:RsiW-degrading membrane proteinase PrsW (M82 family)